jgi:GMP synthase-like glutamine amidotransferase
VKTAILKADGFITSGTDYAWYLSRVLTKEEIYHDVLDLTADKILLQEYDAFLLTGGNTSASDEVGWMQRAIETVADLCTAAVRRDIFLMGICLGAQIIANSYSQKKINRACGHGLEFGFQNVRDINARCDFTVFEFHYEEIDETFLKEPGVKLTHSNKHSIIQGYRIGDNIEAYQFHPEIPPQATAAISAFNASLLKEYRITDVELNTNAPDLESRNETFILAPLRRFFAG